MIRTTVIALASLAGIGAVTAQQAAKVDPAVIEKYWNDTWKKAPEGWANRVVLDETQKICSETRNTPSKEQAAKIVADAKASIALPADGNVLGDWKNGEKIAQSGRGGQFSDGPDTVSGGNCYACHQLAKKELSFGTLGPSLLNYGKLKEFKPEEAKAAYSKVFNAHSTVACSNMPRFGFHKVLTEQQMKDVVAYLFDPESPVNK